MAAGGLSDRSGPLPAAPGLLAWEVTARCNLACPHCRVKASEPADELTTEEGKALLAALARAGVRSLILTGGEPLLRKDLFGLAGYAAGSGLRVLLATNGLLLSRRAARAALGAGVARVSVSIDGATPATHDRLRGPEAFEGALAGLRAAVASGLPAQVNTLVVRSNLDDLRAVHELAVREGACAHHLFLFVPTGCGAALGQERLDGELHRVALEAIRGLLAAARIPIRVTCAPELAAGFPLAASRCLAGEGFAFVSATGELWPCGYLPLRCGSVRDAPLEAIWRHSGVLALARRRSRDECLARVWGTVPVG